MGHVSNSVIFRIRTRCYATKHLFSLCVSSQGRRRESCFACSRDHRPVRALQSLTRQVSKLLAAANAQLHCHLSAPAREDLARLQRGYRVKEKERKTEGDQSQYTLRKQQSVLHGTPRPKLALSCRQLQVCPGQTCSRGQRSVLVNLGNSAN